MMWPARLLHSILLLALTAVAALPSPAAQSWKMVFFHDEDRSSLLLRNLQAPAPGHAVAAGFLSEDGRVRPVMLRTVDGGRNWQQQRLRENPISLFFLDAQRGWMATEKGIWKSEDGGVSWKKISKLSSILSLRFVDERRGFAAGLEKRLLESSDGGVKWQAVAAAAELKADPERSVLSWIEFATPAAGMVVGFHQPARPGDGRLPLWMEPKRSQRRRQVPSLTLLMQTLDGGRTWQASTSSLFGRITRVRLSPETPHGMALFEFLDAFDYSSEVYRISRRDGSSERVYREKNRHVTDAGWLPGGTALLAAVETPGLLAEAPLPGKLKMIMSRDLSAWQEMDVDYRAVAGRAALACGPGGEAWVATDTGMILRLAP